MNDIMLEWETIDISPSEIAITHYNGGGTEEVIVPSNIGSKKVVSILSENNSPVFAYDDKIKKIKFPKTIKEFSGYICEGTAVLDCFEMEANDIFIAKDGVIFTADEETLVLFPPNRKGSYSLPYKVKHVTQLAFYGSELSELACSEQINSISEFAFLNSKLRSISPKLKLGI